MSHPRQDEDRRLGENDESEAAKTPGIRRRSSPPEQKGTETKKDECHEQETVQGNGSAIRKGDLVHTRSEWIAATAFLGLMLAYDPGQSTGPGTHQDNDAATSSQRGGTTDSKSSKNEDSGS